MTCTETSLIVKASSSNTYLSDSFISKHSRHIQSKGKGSKVMDIIKNPCLIYPNSLNLHKIPLRYSGQVLLTLFYG